jgi:hypothetical protein
MTLRYSPRVLNGRVFALTLILSGVVVSVVLWTRTTARSSASDAPAIGPLALLDVTLLGLVKGGDLESAMRAVQVADATEPELGWRHALMLRQHMQHRDPLLERAAKNAQQLLARAPRMAAPEPEYRALPVPADFVSELAYLRGPESDPAFAQVFEDLAAVLGKRAQSLPETNVVLDPERRVVLAPGVKLTSVPVQRTVALAPQPVLEAAFGLAKPASRRMDGCVLSSSHADLRLLSAAALPLPVEGTLSVYARASGTAQVIAIVSCADGEHPAVFRLERAGREPAYMFAFNVLESIVLTRQGDPKQKDKENDGVLGRRPSDLFVRDLSAAQLQMPFSDLLMEALLEVVEGDRPSLRLWHNPAGTRGVFIVTSDQDFVEEDRLAIMLAALAQWRAPATLYLTSGTYQEDGEQRLTAPNPTFVELARAHGMSIAAHTSLMDERRPPTEIIAEHVSELRRAYGQPPTSNRFHYARWSGYTDLPEALADNGYRYDTSYITVHSTHIAALGYMTGAGLPLPFYTERGVALRTHQLATQLDDHVHPAYDTRLRGANGELLIFKYDALLAMTKSLVQSAGRRYHSPLVINNHPLQFAEDSDWLHVLIETARVEQLGVLNVDGYATFMRALTDSMISHTAGEPEYRVLVQAPEQDLIVRHYAGEAALVDGRAQPLRPATLYDAPVRLLRLPRGTHTVALP